MNVQAPDGEDECVLDLKTAGTTISFNVGTSDAEGGTIKVDFGGGNVKDYEIGKKDTILIDGEVSDGSVKGLWKQDAHNISLLPNGIFDGIKRVKLRKPRNA